MTIDKKIYNPFYYVANQKTLVCFELNSDGSTKGLAYLKKTLFGWKRVEK